MKRLLIFFGVFLICFGVGMYKLTAIPGDWYGDISIVHEYVASILSGGFPWQYMTSAGPLYHYLIAPTVLVFGHQYIVYKTLSVCVGMIALTGMFLLAAELLGFEWGMVTTLLAGTSFWWLAWERTGNSQILIVVLTSYTIWCVLRWRTTGALRFVVWGTILSSLGLFLYPQTWVLPPLYVLLFILSGRPRSYWAGAWMLIILSVVAVSWYFVVRNSGTIFAGGYIGSKLWPVFTVSPIVMLSRFALYVWRTVLMLHIRGDGVFRVNVPGSPQLDGVSGVLFLIGICWWMRRNHTNLFPFLWIPIMVLILPSVSPALPIAEIPNSGRTIGILPFVMVLVGSGVRALFERVPNAYRRWRTIGIGILLISVIGLNGYKYFIQYPQGLPNHNIPTARLIAQFVDTIPQSVPVYWSDCCWEDHGQPEPKAVYYQLHTTYGRNNLLAAENLACRDIERKHGAYVIGRPDVTWTQPIAACATNGIFTLHTDSAGRDLFGSYYLPSSAE